MPSDAAKKRQQQKKERKIALDKKRIAEQQSKGKTKQPSRNGSGSETQQDENKPPTSEKESSKESPPTIQKPDGATPLTKSDGATPTVSTVTIDMKQQMTISPRSSTGVLTSHPDSRDVHIGSLSVSIHGVELLADAKLELNCGRRYGLVGLNGSGKSTLLAALGDRELPIPAHVDIYHLREEIPSSDKTPLECVIEVDAERIRLEEELEMLTEAGDTESERLQDIYERLDELDASTAETKAARILHGLGFTHEMQHKKCRDFSGGWRMRVSLARALFVKPHLLLLDEPTNHLDLEACVWLEEELKRYKRCLVLISHSQDFLNGVCTNIIHLLKNRLYYYGGNYDAYVRTRLELQEHQMKRYNWEKEQMAHMKDYIQRFGRGSNAKQAQSKEKVLAKMVAGGLAEKVVQDKVVSFSFPDCGSLPPPVIMVQEVSFRYGKGKPLVYDRIDFGMDLDTRVALVGPNGAGKSTLLKLIDGDLNPTDGIIRRHAHLKTGRYHQHLKDYLNLDESAMTYMMRCYPEEKEEEQMRRALGRYGLTGRQQVCPMRNLSDGQKCRITFAWLAFRHPHMLLLDEPTNHLDMETIDALADAINEFDGGMVLVSHDFRLISQVAKEIWICENGSIRKWPDDILSYKQELKKKLKYKL